MKTTTETASFLVLNAVLAIVAMLALILPASCIREPATPILTGVVQVGGAPVAYEIRGDGGRPLVLLHDAGCSLDTCLGGALPALAKHRRVVGLQLTAVAATDAAGALAQLGIAGAEVFVLSAQPAQPVEVAIALPLLRSM